MRVIWGRDKAKYFFGEDWTGGIRLNRLEKLIFCRRVSTPSGSISLLAFIFKYLA